MFLSGHGPTSTKSASRLVLVLLSLGTAVWLIVVLSASAILHAGSWPAGDVTPFAGDRTSVIKPHVQVRTQSGSLAALTPADFGFALTNQYEFYIADRVIVVHGDSIAVAPDGRRALRKLVSIWARTHANDRPLSVKLSATIFPLPPGTPPRTLNLLEMAVE